MFEIAKTINIYIIADMERATPDATYEYLDPVILDNKIVIMPANKSGEANFIDAGLSNEFVTENYEVDNIRTFGINLTANIVLVDTDNEDYYIDEERLKNFGEIVIALDANKDDTPGYVNFVDPITVNNESDLKVEDLEDVDAPVEDEEASKEIKDVHAEVLTEADEVIEEPSISDSEEGPEWEVKYDLKESLKEAEGEEIASSDAIERLNAPDMESAVKYAKQLARIKAKEDNRWTDAEVISISKNDIE